MVYCTQLAQKHAKKLELPKEVKRSRKNRKMRFLRQLNEDGLNGKQKVRLHLRLPDREIRASKLGKKHSQKTKALMSSQRRGVSKSPEHRAKISAALKGLPKTPEHRAKTLKQYMKGAD